jgi:hypothetical protein
MARLIRRPFSGMRGAFFGCMPGASLGVPTHRRLADALNAPSSDSKFQTTCSDIATRLAAFAKTSAGLTLSTSPQRKPGPITTGVCRRNDSGPGIAHGRHLWLWVLDRHSLSLACPGRRWGLIVRQRRGCASAFPRQDLRALLKHCPSKIRGRREYRVRVAPAVACATKSTRVSNHGHTLFTPAFPARQF